MEGRRAEEQRDDAAAARRPRRGEVALRREVVFERRIEVDGRVVDDDRRIRQPRAEQPEDHQIGDAQAAAARVLHGRARRGREFPGHEIVDDFRYQRAHVGDELEVRSHAALEGVLGHHPLAEGVDRVHRGLVDGGERPFQAAHVGGAMRASRDELPERGVGRRARGERRARFTQALADAVSQLGRRGVGERHDQDAIDGELLLHDETDEERRDRCVLPVPALASMSCTPVSATAKGSSGIMTRQVPSCHSQTWQDALLRPDGRWKNRSRSTTER